MCCSWFAANTGRKKVAKNRHLGTIAQLRRAISSQIRHISTIGKNLLSSNTSSTCPYNMVNLSPLMAEILSLVWGTPANFNGSRVLAALLHGAPSRRQPKFAALNRGRHLHSAGRPSRWALAHILVYIIIIWFFRFCLCVICECWKWFCVVVDHSSYGECQAGLWQVCSTAFNCTMIEYTSK